MQWLEAEHIPGMVALTPGIRSLQIRYDSTRKLPLGDVMDTLRHAGIYAARHRRDRSAPSRIVHLPLSWDESVDSAGDLKNIRGQYRADAPWSPSNIEFIRRINGLADLEEVQRIVFDASYLVLGFGDGGLGAPVTMAIDPRHRLVATEYNPARTRTPQNAVGIGGAYLCVDGMEGPGSSQLVQAHCAGLEHLSRDPGFRGRQTVAAPPL